jgi:hypothetical protein
VEFAAAGSPHLGDENIPDHVDVSSPAPYVAPTPDEQSDEERLSVVAGLPDPFQKWVYWRADELTSVGGNGRPNYDDLREELGVEASTATSRTTTWSGWR